MLRLYSSSRGQLKNLIMICVSIKIGIAPYKIEGNGFKTKTKSINIKLSFLYPV